MQRSAKPFLPKAAASLVLSQCLKIGARSQFKWIPRRLWSIRLRCPRVVAEFPFIGLIFSVSSFLADTFKTVTVGRLTVPQTPTGLAPRSPHQGPTSGEETNHLYDTDLLMGNSLTVRVWWTAEQERCEDQLRSRWSCWVASRPLLHRSGPRAGHNCCTSATSNTYQT